MSSFPEPFTIVMIEDDEGHAKLIKKNLERSCIGNEITHLDDGQKAIDFLFGKNEVPFNSEKTLILLDLNLPKVDGYEILRRLKSEETTHNIPVIVLTTTDNPREIDKCYDLGCNVYITKPVGYDNFTDAIRKLGLMLAVVKLPHGLKK